MYYKSDIYEKGCYKDTFTIENKHILKKKDNLNKSGESQHLYENQNDNDGYENFKQCFNDENEYEEII